MLKSGERQKKADFFSRDVTRAHDRENDGRGPCCRPSGLRLPASLFLGGGGDGSVKEGERLFFLPWLDVTGPGDFKGGSEASSQASLMFWCSTHLQVGFQTLHRHGSPASDHHCKEHIYAGLLDLKYTCSRPSFATWSPSTYASPECLVIGGFLLAPQ